MATNPSPTVDAQCTAAISARDATLLRSALALGARPTDHVGPVLALQPACPDLLAALLNAGLDPNARMPGHRGVLLNVAAAFGQADYVSLLLERGADPDVVGPTATGPRRGEGGWMSNNLGPLGAAVEGFMVPVAEERVREVLERLLDGGAKVAGSGALQVAARRGRVECARLLLERGAPAGESVPRVEEGKTAMALAREYGQEGVVKVLEEHGAE